MADTPLIKSLPEKPVSGIEVRLARTEEELTAAQKLRYQVFYEENGARPTEALSQEKRDKDIYDDIADHLIVVHTDPGEGINGLIGTYRLLRQSVAEARKGFYSSSEYDLTPLLQTGANCLELGRSCVMAQFRTKPVIQLLWSGISQYIAAHDIEMLFGCASLPGTDINALSAPLSYLYHYHLAPAYMRPSALTERHIEMNILEKDDISVRAVFSSLPPLIKGYLRIGCLVGNGAVADHDFNTVDVCMILPVNSLAQRYKSHYERKNRISFSQAPLHKNRPGSLQGQNLSLVPLSPEKV